MVVDMLLQEFSNLLSSFRGALAHKWFIAILIIIAGWVFTKLFEKLMKKHAPRSLAGKVRRTIRFAKVVVWVLIGAWILGYLELGSNLLLSATVIGAAITFISQDLLGNAAAGIYIIFARPFAHGEIIKLNNIFGEVYDIGIVSTKIRTLNNEFVTIPNAVFLENEVTNYDTEDPRIVVEVEIGVEYGTDLETAKGIILDTVALYAMEEHKVLMDPKPVVWTMNFGNSSIVLQLRAYIDFAKDLYCVPSELRDRIKTAFDKEGIIIAFPQSVIHFAKDRKNRPNDSEPPVNWHSE